MPRFICCLLALFVVTFAAGETRADDAQQKQAIEMITQMADVIDQNKSDCDKMAKELDAWWEKGAKGFAKLKGMDFDDSNLSPALKAKMEGAVERMMGGLMACTEHPGVMESFARIGAAMEGDEAKPVTSVEATSKKTAGPGDERAVVLFEELAAVVGSDSGCESKAKALDAFWSKNKKEFADLDKITSEALTAEHQARVDVAMQGFVNGMMVCAEDPDFMEVFNRMGDEMNK